MRKTIVIGAAALLLGGCPQEEEEVSIRFDPSGRPVFEAEDQRDCLTRYSISLVEPSGTRTPIWSVESPMPISRPGPCALGFPIVYGEAQGARATYPNEAPPLRPGRLYAFSGEGGARRYFGEFRLP